MCFNKARGKTGFRAMEWLVSCCMLFSLQIHIQYRHHCGNDPLFGQGFFMKTKTNKYGLRKQNETRELRVFGFVKNIFFVHFLI